MTDFILVRIIPSTTLSKLFQVQSVQEVTEITVLLHKQKISLKTFSVNYKQLLNNS